MRTPVVELRQMLCCNTERWPRQGGYAGQRAVAGLVAPMPWNALRDSGAPQDFLLGGPSPDAGYRPSRPSSRNQRQLMVAPEGEERSLHQVHLLPEQEPMLQYHSAPAGLPLDYEGKAPPPGRGQSGCCPSCCRWLCGICCVLVEVVLAAGVTAFVCATRASSNVADLAAPELGSGAELVNASALHAFASRLHRPWTDNASGQVFGFANASDAPSLLFNATRGTKNQSQRAVPEKLRGVYWMRGNALPEVLVAVQHGEWHGERGALMVPKAPLSRAWFGGPRLRPPRSVSSAGWFYKLLGGSGLAEFDSTGLVSLSFDSCPDWARCAGLPASENLTFATAQVHPRDDPAELKQVSRYVFTSLEEVAGEVVDGNPGSHWHVRSAAFSGHLEIGSYDLVRVINPDGSKSQPHHQEFEAFMGGEPAIVWSGYEQSLVLS
ncbi:unnamed protein product [Prorocentrum cordatum]|uniref:Uncharacterized protein n=2 Tax=Prorocentrum cordatum TaxID=2364126 RepID=A0ABN9PSA1_9DINO|nr:unnamed protein product [Polarella glacialis]